MIEETITVKGRVTILLEKANGQIVEEEFDNLVVTLGKNFIASRMAANTAAIMSHMAVGTGAVAAANGDTVLGAELARQALTSGGASGATVTYVATFAAGTGTGALTEAGIFNASGAGAGTLLNRVTFPTVNKGASDSLTITWQVTIS